MGTITAANSVYILTVPGVFDAPQQLQGYATDAAFETAESENAEVVIGVDGIISAGFVPFMTEQTISFQADSDSAILFEQWLQAEKAALEKFEATANISLPSIGRKYALTNGFLMRVTSIPGARKVLQARNFTIRWGDISPAPV